MNSAGSGTDQFDILFEPIRLGPMSLQSRVMSPPHFSAIGNLWGSDKDAERTLAYWDRRMDASLGLIVMTGRIAHHLIPGFEPTGMSADPVGFFRLPVWMERAKAFRAACHAKGAKLACQMTMIGNHPFTASRRLSSPVSNNPPHVMTREDIASTVAEYRWSARQAREAGLDGIEVHANHDDILQYFLSPMTNELDDQYGGKQENRCRFLVEMLRVMREEVGPEMAIGVRLNMAEGVVMVRHSYSQVERQINRFDTVVLSCGGVSDNALHEELKGKVRDLHILGDAYAPRKLTFATRQAFALAKLLNTAASVRN